MVSQVGGRCNICGGRGDKRMLFESTRSMSLALLQNKTSAHLHTLRFFGGRGWIRTTEAEKQQIYSLSPLATREHAQILFTSLPDDLFILADKSGFVNRFFAFFQLLFSRTKKRRSLAEILRSGCAVLRTIHGAGRLPLLRVPDVSGAHSPGGPQWPRRKADRAR